MICPHCGKETGNTVIANALMPGLANAAQPNMINVIVSAANPNVAGCGTYPGLVGQDNTLCSAAYNPPLQITHITL